MPNPLNPLSDPESPDPKSDPETSDPSSGGGSKGWGTLEEKPKPKGKASFADPIDEDSEPQQGTGGKAGRKETVTPKGKS